MRCTPVLNVKLIKSIRSRSCLLNSEAGNGQQPPGRDILLSTPQPPLPHCLKVRFREQSWVLETVPLASSYPLSSCEGKRRCAKGGRLHCPGTQPIDHAGNPKTPLHADTGQAALGPLQPHIQVTPGPARSVGQAITRTLPPTLILTYYHRPPTPGSSPFPGTC